MYLQRAYIMRNMHYIALRGGKGVLYWYRGADFAIVIVLHF